MISSLGQSRFTDKEFGQIKWNELNVATQIAR